MVAVLGTVAVRALLCDVVAVSLVVVMHGACAFLPIIIFLPAVGRREADYALFSVSHGDALDAMRRWVSAETSLGRRTHHAPP